MAVTNKEMKKRILFTRAFIKFIGALQAQSPEFKP
jgi:hypothetical protein